MSSLRRLFVIAAITSIGCAGLLDLRDDYFVETSDAAAPPSDGSIDGGGSLVDGSLDAPDVDTTPPPPLAKSCRDLADTCGTEANESCCSSILVEGGKFRRGERFDDGGYDESKEATVSSFRLDKYLVTGGRFRRFVDAVKAGYHPNPGDGKHTHLPDGGLKNVVTNRTETGWADSYGSLPRSQAEWTDILMGPDCHEGVTTWSDGGTMDERALNCVPWHAAYAFCIWDGGFLPTDAEYNYAAVGGAEQRFYPWSQPSTNRTITWEHASYSDRTGPVKCTGDPTFGGAPHECTNNDIVVPGIKTGRGRWGQADLAGNLLEYTLDCYRPLGSCTDCVTFIESCGTNHSMRGSSYDDGADMLRGAMRRDEHYYPVWNGFRCARSP
jgi:formylglycine-generating enzyme required for sulfatase activity